LHVSGEIHLVNSYVMHYELLLDERYAIYREHEVKIYATNGLKQQNVTVQKNMLQLEQG